MTSAEDDERVVWYRPPELPETEILIAERSTRTRSTFHLNYAVCTGINVATVWRYRGKTHAGNDGSLMLMEPGETHVNIAVHKPQDFKVLFMSPQVVREAAYELGISTTPHLAAAHLERRDLFGAFARFHGAIERGESRLEQQSRFAACLHSLLESCLEQPVPHHAFHGRSAVESVKRYLSDRWNEPVALDELAAVSGISRFHLVRTFATQVGVPPHRYQILIRVEQARSLLQRGVPAVEAAVAAGFADQSHLIRHFKRVLASLLRSTYAADHQGFGCDSRANRPVREEPLPTVTKRCDDASPGGAAFASLRSLAELVDGLVLERRPARCTRMLVRATASAKQRCCTKVISRS